MKILMLNAYYEPEVAASMYLTTNINEDLVKYGFELDVYTPMPSRGISEEIIKKYESIPLEVLYDGKLKIHRFSIPREGKNSLLRALRYVYLNFILLVKGIFAKADVIFIDSTPPTQGFMAAILKKIKRIPVVFYLQDIFPDSLVNAGMTKNNSIIFKIGRFIENYTYKNVDKIIVISEDFKQNIMAKGVPEDKIEVVYIWVDEKAVIPIARSNNKLIDIYGLDKDKFYITYCGNIGFSQNMDMLVDVAKDLENYPNMFFGIFGDGAYKEELQAQIINKNIKNVMLIPFQPYEDISHVFSLCDAGLIISKSGIGQNSIPSKTWSIMSAERAVIASFDLDSELSRIIKESECGLCTQADNKEELKKAILDLYNNKEKTIEMGKKGRRYIIENLTRETGTYRIIDIIGKVVVNK